MAYSIHYIEQKKIFKKGPDKEKTGTQKETTKMKVTIILTKEKELEYKIEELYQEVEYLDSLIDTSEMDEESTREHNHFISGKYKEIHELEKKLEEMQRRN